MEGLIAILIITAAIVAFDIVASRWGADSRDLLVEARRPVPTAGLTVR